ncbi:glutamate-gated chloride channel alpha3A subunit [Aphelenchoides avenae]|nr:glutamate-gated chloride channel alpha3A subunit [Aphelenchus avenae]
MARNGSSPSAPRCHKRGHFTAGLAYKRMLSMLGFLVLLTVLPPCSGLKERDVLKHILADYDKDERPPGRNNSLVTLDCHFYLNNFPFDQQECELKVASYSRTADDIVYKWQDIHPVQVREGALMVPSFGRFADDMETDYCDSNTNTGTYSCLRLTIKLQRTSWPYVMQLYVPTTMLVIIAWLAFSLDKKSTTARILLCIASLALIIAISLVVNSRVLLTAYVKSTDVWIGVCLAYVFYALVESVIVSSGADSPRSRKNEYNQVGMRQDVRLAGYTGSARPDNDPDISANGRRQGSTKPS